MEGVRIYNIQQPLRYEKNISIPKLNKKEVKIKIS